MALDFLKRKAGSPGWCRTVFGNVASAIGWAMRGVSIAIGWVFKKVPWKPILGWGPWVVVVLVLGFYGVENWRGARAWKKVRTEWLARGEKLKVAEFMPAAIADEENFAKHPVVVAEMHEGSLVDGPRSRLLKGFNGVSKRVYGIWFGTPDLGEAVDVTKWLPVGERLGTEAECARRCLELMGPIDGEMAGIAEGVRRPGCDFDLHGESGPLAERWNVIQLFPTLRWVNAFSSRMQLQVRAGDGAAALEDLETIVLLTEKMHGHPLLVAALIEAAMLKTLKFLVWEGLRAEVWSAEELGELESMLSRVDCLGRGFAVLKCEVAYTAEITEEMAANRDQIPLPVDFGGLIFGGTPTWRDEVTQKIQRGLIYMIPRGWFDHLRAGTLSGMDQCVFRPGGVETNRLSFGMVAALNGEVERMGEGLFDSFRSQSLASFAKAIERMISTQGGLDLMRVAVGLERFRLRTGKYPRALDELLPHELQLLPIDLVSGEALRYRLKEDGTPVTWAVGFNLVDDGGVPARQPEMLDWVWQYTGTAGQSESEWGRGQMP